MQQSQGEKRFRQSLNENVPLAPLTTLGIGGQARYFAEIADSRALVAGVAWARSRGIPLFVLGGGSNIVVSDEGFSGLVLRVCIRGIKTRFEAGCAIVTAGAGEEWDPFVAACVANEWAGLECLSGIPGRVGATPIQNVGAYGQETSETLERLEALDLETGEMVEMSADQCEFGYRASRFKTRERNRFIITSVTYRLTARGKPKIRYAELQRYLAERAASEPNLASVREAVLAIRRRKAMVIDANDADSRSVGSFFVNPTVTMDELEQIERRASRLAASGERVPAFPVSDGLVKLSAAWLIEQAGFKRGHVYGNVGTSTKHALAIINRGGGTAREVLLLAEQIKSRVRELFGVTLTPEPVLVGFEQQS